jgi:hypothetical protein
MSNVKTLFTVTKDAIGFLDTFLFFTPFGGAALIIAAFTSALSGLPTISKIFYSIGVAIILIPLLVVAILKMRKKVKEQTQKPESLIFLNIGRFDASTIGQGKDYVVINYTISSALSYDLVFNRVDAELIFNSANQSIKKVMEPLTVKKQKSEGRYIEIYLGDKIPSDVKNNLQHGRRNNIKMIITLWDTNAKPHELTDEREMIALN